MKRIHNKGDIVQVGLDLVLSRGFNATGVEAILKQANVPKGSFYNFFSSKEEFALAIIDKFFAGRTVSRNVGRIASQRRGCAARSVSAV